MAIDISRVAAAAIDTALNDGTPPRRRRSGLRAVAAGAALATVARVAVTKAPELRRVLDVSRVTERVRDELAERGWLPEENEELAEPEEDELDEEPEDEADS